MRVQAFLLAVTLVLAAPACVSVTWERHRVNEPLPESALVWAQDGGFDLTAALAHLGAPTHVWELPGGAIALAWGWRREHELGLRLSIPVTGRQSASFTYTGIDARLFGLVVVFDESNRAVLVRCGHLAELARSLTRRRPRFDPAWAGV